ncbi:MAG: ribosome small subunit-dependent GTPase A [Candidatus Saccharimonas sp.]
MQDKSWLVQLGYTQFFDESRERVGVPIEQLARVTAEHRGVYELLGMAGPFRAAVTGKRVLTAASRDDFPAVGDWVVIRSESDGTKVITGILPRRTALHKKRGGRDETQLIATNVDVAFIVESIDRDYSLNRFERYLVIAREGGVQPVIILNKSDLSSEEDIAKSIIDIHERFGETEVLTTNTITDSGLEKLAGYIEKGKTYCFLGSSGVGKSSIINTLLEQDHIATKAISEKTGRGMHTTTSRAMYVTQTGGIIIDNPGSREVGVVGALGGVEEVFVDIEAIAHGCTFQDCTHANELGCAVLDALKTGSINAAQYENYRKMKREAERRGKSTFERRKQEKRFGRFVKNAKSELNKFESDSIQDQ